jgi:hypothetical protein
MAAFGASIPPRSGGVDKPNGYRPFSLGGGNGSKCPELPFARAAFRASLVYRKRTSDGYWVPSHTTWVSCTTH